MLRSLYHYNNGSVGRAIHHKDKITHGYDYGSKLVKDCVRELKKGNVAYCYTLEHLQAILDKSNVAVEYEPTACGYKIWRV